MAAKPSRAIAPPAVAAPWRRLMPPLLVVVVVVVLFAPVCSHEFVTWDDYDNVARNLHYNPPTIEGLISFWDVRKPYLAMYIPVTYSVWGLLGWLGQLPQNDAQGLTLNPYVFHAANLVLHVVAALLVYCLVRRLVGARWPAAAGALLFAVHPVQVEAVAWVTGLKDVLCGVLSLLSLWLYLLYADGRGAAAGAREPHHVRPGVLYTAATLCLVLALLAKPSAVVVPLLAVVLSGNWRRAVRAMPLWFALAAACAIIAASIQHGAVSGTAAALWQRPLIAGDALAFYVRQLLLPGGFGIDYGRTPGTVLAGRGVWAWWLVPVALGVICFAFRRRRPALWTGAAVFFLALLPVLGLMPFDFQHYSTVADRYLYLSMLGAALAAGALLSPPARQGAGAGHTLVRVSVAAAVLIVLCVMSARQIGTWENSRQLLTHALEVNGDSLAAYTSLATLELDDHHPQAAIDDCLEAIKRRPDSGQAYVTLGAALRGIGRDDLAIAPLNQAVALEPRNLPALDNLAGALARRHRFEESLAASRRALACDAGDATAHRNIGTVLAEQQHWPEARAELETALRLNPQDTDAKRNLAYVMARLRNR